FIGPEGGFEPEEAAFLIDLGAKCVTLGPRILRTETAGLTALALMLYEFDEMM
ncbi:MAG: RNA methyltransferase, partial [Clostridia bacterium]|nr:RNA methyltransferase [Clostridia bacterium]